MTKIREKQNRKLAQCLMASAMSANMLLTSLGGTAYAASDITKSDTTGVLTHLKDANGVFNIFADSATQNNAVNHFTKFNLDPNNIANLYFRTSADGADAANLLNFVDDRINIYGTVNAIRNSAVGGNLYFVSVNGMVVGSSGVINAGAINVMTPTSTEYSDFTGKIKDGGKNDAMYDTLQNNNYAVNPEGTITVAGNLNAVDGIKLRAANISLEEKAVLRTESELDFSKLVNINNADGSTAVDSELTGGTLKATEGTNGDIILSAIAASTAVSPSEEDEVTKDFAARTRTATIKTAGADKEQNLDGSSISARGNVDIYATATNEDAGWSTDGGYDAGITNPLGQVVFTKATIELNGNVTGQKIIAAANSSNEYNSSNDTSTVANWAGSIDKNAHWKTSYNKIQGLSDTLNVIPIYSYMDSEASVTVGKNATLKSTLAMEPGHKLEDDKKDPAIALTATSSTTNIVQAATSSAEAYAIPETKAKAGTAGTNAAASQPAKAEASKANTAQKAKTTHLAGAAVAYDGTSSSATVDVQGTLTANGAINMNAQSTDAMNVKTVANGAAPTATGTAPKLNAAIAVATGDNAAAVKVGEGAQVTSAESGVYATAAAVNSIDVISQVTANATALGATSVSVLDYTSDAAVNLDGQVSGALVVAGTAANKTIRNNLTANNAMTTTPMTPQQKTAAASANKVPNAKDGLIETSALDKYVKSLGTTYTSITGKLDTAGNLLSVGAAIGIGIEKNTADVNVGSTSILTAPKGGIALGASTDLADTHMTALSGMTNKNPGQNTDGAIGAAVLYAQLDNTSNVKIADGQAAKGKHAVLQAAKVAVSSASTQEYDRAAGMLDDIHKIYKDFSNMVDTLDSSGLNTEDQAQFKSNVEQIGAIYNSLNNGLTKVTGLNARDFSANMSEMPKSILSGLTGMVSFAAGIQHILAEATNPKGFFKTEVDTLTKALQSQLLMWTLPENYATFAASSSVNMAGSAGNTLALAGAANINILNNTANIAVGNNAVLTAGAKGLSLATDVGQNSVMMNGKPNIGINPDFLSGSIDEVLYGKDGWETKLKNIENKAVLSYTANTAAPNAVGGAVGVAEHSTIGTITVGSGAQLTGHDWTELVDVNKTTEDTTDDEQRQRYGVELTADNENKTLALSYGAGEAGKLGFEGLFSWLGGNATNTITVAKDAALMAKGEKTEWGKIDVAANMNNILTNIAGAVAWGTGGISMGASVAVTDETVTNTISLGGTFDAGSFDANALTDGVINTVAIAGSEATTNSNANTTKAGSQIKANDKKGKVQAAENKANKDASTAQDKANADVKTANEKTANTSQGSTNTAASTTEAANNQKAPTLQLAASGSVAVNAVTSDTEAGFTGGTITLHDNGTADRAVNVKAEDASYIGAYSGAAAAAWKQPAKIADNDHALKKVEDTFTEEVNADGETVYKLKANTQVTTKGAATKLDEKSGGAKPAASSTSQLTDGTASTLEAAMAGAAAVNAADQTVKSSLVNVTIANADTIQNIAQKDGATVAAGLGMSLAKDLADGANAFAGAGAASFNEASNTVEASMSGVNTESVGLVNNLAYDSDTQIAGGVNLTLVYGGKTGAGVGGSLAISDIHNSLTAKMADSNLSASSVQNHAANDITQVTTAIGFSGTHGDKTSASFDGTLASSSITNSIQAIMDKDTVTGTTVDNAAYDADGLTKNFDQDIANAGIDSTGATYKANAGDNAATDTDPNGKNYAINTAGKGSSVQITTALSLAVNAGDGVGGEGAAAVGILQNDLSASVQNSTITVDTLNAWAASNALLINVAAGTSISGGSFSGAGSASAQYTSNTTQAAVDDSKIQAASAAVNAASSDLNVNVAGQVSAGKNGAGLAVAFNHQNNTTGTYMRGSTLNSRSDDGFTALSLTAENKGQVYAVGAGVSGGKTSAVNGSLAINQGKDDIEAVVDQSVTGATDSDKKRTSISRASSVEVDATDSSTKVAVAGGIQGSGKAAVGGAVAYNEIGDWSHNESGTYKNERQQQAQAVINHTDITMASTSKNAPVNVKAADTSELGTASAGVGGAGNVAVEGAASVALIGKEAYAEMIGSNIEFGNGIDPRFADVKVESHSTGKVNTVAVVAAGTGSGAAVGAGIGVNYDNADSRAAVSGGTMVVDNLAVTADSKDDILNIGIGGSGTGTGAAITGSVAVNILQGHTSADISGDADVTAENNVIVTAQRDGAIGNLSGLGQGAGTGAAVGLSVSVNDIQNETTATVSGQGTKIKAKGNDTEAIVSDAYKKGLTDDFLNTEGSTAAPASFMERGDNTYSGLAVSASSTNSIAVYTLNAGGAGTGAAVVGNINVSKVGGRTAAEAVGSSFDTGTKDIHVVANDYANNTAFLGSFSGTGIGASVGLGSNTLTVNRKVNAHLSGYVDEKGNVQTASVTAGQAQVTADAGYSANAINAGVAVGGEGAAAVNTDNITLLNGETKAAMDHTALTLSGNLAVKANRQTQLHTVGISGALAGLGGSIGLGIDAVKDDSVIGAGLSDTAVTLTQDNTSVIDVTANNETHDNYQLYTINGSGIVSIGSNIAVGNMAAKVTTDLDHATIGEAHPADTTKDDTTKQAKSITVKSANDMTVKQKDWTGTASGMAVGSNISVVTVDSDVDTTVENSHLYSDGEIDVAASDARDANLQLGNTAVGGAAGNLNVGIMTVGHKVEDKYAYTNTDTDQNGKTTTTTADSGADLGAAFTKANAAIDDNTLTAQESLGTGQSGPEKSTTEASKGKDTTTSIDTKVTNSVIAAGAANVNVTSTAKTTATRQGVTASAAGCSALGDVAVLDAARNASLTATDSTIIGNEITLNSQLTGESALDIYQGTAAASSADGAFAFTRMAGCNKLQLDGTTLAGTKKVSVAAGDDSAAKVNVVGAMASVAEGSLQIAQADAIGAVSVVLGTGNTITASDAAAGTISIAANNAPSLTVKVDDGAAGLAGMGITAVSAQVGSSGRSLSTSLDAGNGNVFVAPEVKLTADALATTTADISAVSVAVGNLQINHNQADNYSDVTVTAGQNQYGSSDKDAKQAAELTIQANNTAVQDVSAGSVTAAGIAFVSNNKSSVHDVFNTTVTATGMDTASNLTKANINAATGITTAEEAKSFGGALDVAASAAETKHELTTHTQTLLSGTWNMTDALVTTATNKEELNLSADTGSAAILNGSGACIDSDVLENAVVTVSNASITTGGDQTYNAGTQTNDHVSINTSGYGGLTELQSSNLNQNQTYSGKVNLNGISATGGTSEFTAGGNIAASAATLGSMVSDNELHAGVGGLDGTLAYGTYVIGFYNDVNVDKALLKTKNTKSLLDSESGTSAVSNLGGDISLAAYDDTQLNFKTLAESQGSLASGVSAHTDVDLDRNESVYMKDGSTLYSAGDANLYAGRTAKGASAGTNMTIQSDTYNQSLIPFANRADIDNTLTQANTVKVDAGAVVQTAGDVNLAANSGSDSIQRSANKYIWGTYIEADGSITTTSSGTVSGTGAAAENGVTINGAITAGIHNNAEVEITGDVTKNADGSFNNSGIKVAVKQGADWLKPTDFTGRLISVDNPYLTQYKELQKLVQQYPHGQSGTSFWNSTEYKQYAQQMAALGSTMEKEGFAEEAKNNKGKVLTDKLGNIQYIVYEQKNLESVSMPDMSVSGGNVNVHADKLVIGGSLTANGSPTITVTNRTPLEMIVNNVEIDSAGGDISYNGRRVDSASSAVGLSGANHIHPGAAGKSSITITNSGSASDILHQTPDLIVSGDVVNQAGAVTLESMKGNITISGNANVSGQTVCVMADAGNVTQESPDGILYIGDNPISRWIGGSETAAAFQKLYYWYMTEGFGTQRNHTLEGWYPSYESFYQEWIRGSSSQGRKTILTEYSEAKPNEPLDFSKLPAHQPTPDASKGTIAGGNVFISGKEVNLNGLVQSGYDSYTAVLDNNVQSKIKRIIADYKKEELDDSAVKGNQDYCVSLGGSYYDSTKGYYRYRVPVYYNPSTKHILVDDITATGGQINITGNIGNTDAGAGRILAANGAANINISADNNVWVSDGDLVLGNIQNVDRKGSVRITDTLQNKVFEYQNVNGENQYNVHEVGKTGNWMTNAGAMSFTPSKDLTYQWTGGETKQTTTSYTYTTTDWVWGLVDGSISPKTIISQHGSDTVQTGYSKQDRGIINGDYFITQHMPGTNSVFIVNGAWKRTEYNDQPVTTTEKNAGIFGGGFKKEYTYSWTENEGDASSTTSILKADNPISIGFLNAADAGIQVTANGGLIVSGGITAATSNEKVVLQSDNGSLTGNGIINTNHLSASAFDDINLQQTALNNDDTADVSLQSYRGSIALHSEGGNLNILSAQAGTSTTDYTTNHTTVDIHASGDILNGADSGAAIKGTRINLASDNGTIGTADKAMLVQAGNVAVSGNPEDASLSASAQKGIYLTQVSGDMRVNSISSRDGDVVLSADGNIVNAAPIAETTVAKNTRVQTWTDAGLISTKDTDGSRENAAQTAKSARQTALALRLGTLANGNASKIQSYKDAAAAYVADEAITAARTKYISAMKEATTEADRTAAKAAYAAAQTEHFQGEDFSKAEQQAIINYAEVTREDAAYGWSKNQLLYAVQDSVLNSKAGAVSLSDTANVSGKNITLNAGKGIGADMNAVIYDKAALKTDAAQQALAQARAGDLTVNRDANGNFTGITMEQHQPLNIKLTDTDTGTLKITDKTHTYIATATKDKLRLTGNLGNDGYNAMFLAGAGITQTAGTTIRGNNLTLESGTGAIGTTEQAVQTAITGELSANSGDSMYISQTGAAPLTVKTATAGKDITLRALNGIVMSAVEAGKAVGYLTAGDFINLSTASGSIGDDNGRGIRILNNGVAVDAEAKQGNVYLTGEKNGDLVLGTITAKELSVTDDTGTVKLARAKNTTQTASNATVKVNKATIAAQDIDLTDGRMEATGANGLLTFKAVNTITQANTEKSVLGSTGTVTFQTGKAATAGGTIDVESQYNDFANVNLRAAAETAGINGYIKVVSNAANGLTANFGAVKEEKDDGMLTVTGGGSKKLDVQVWNVADGINKAPLTLSGKLTTVDTGMLFTSGDTLTVAAGTELNSGKALGLIGKKGVTTGGTDQKPVTLKAATDLVVQAAEGTIDLSKTGDTITAGGTEELTGQSIKLYKLQADAAKLTATAGDIAFTGPLLTATSLTATATGSIKAADERASIGANNASGSLTMTAGQDITLWSVQAGTVNLTATKGSIDLNGTTTNFQSLTAKAGQDISLNNNTGITRADSLSVEAGRDVKVDKDLAVTGVADLKAGGALNLNGITKAQTLHAKAGQSISLNNLESYIQADSLSVEADKDITVEQALTVTGVADLKAGGALKLNGLYTKAQTLNAKVGQSITLDHPLFVSDTLTVNSGGDIDLVTLVAAKHIVLDAAENITTARILSQNFTAQAGGNLTIDKEAKVTGDLSLRAGGELVIPTTVKAGGSLTLASGTAIQLDTAEAVRGNVTIRTIGGSNINVTNLSAGGSSTIQQSGGILQVNDLSAGGAVDIQHTGAGNITLDSVSAGGLNVAQQGTGSVVMGKAAVNGDSTIQQANGDIQVDTLAAGGSSTIEQSGGNLQITDLTAGGSNTIQQSGGTLKVNNLTAGKTVDIQHEGSGDITLDTVKAETLNVAQKGTGSIAIGKAAVNGDSAIQQVNGDIQVDTLTAGGSSTIEQASGNLQITDLTAGDSNTIEQAGGTLTVKNLTAGGTANIQHTGDGDITLDNVSARNLKVYQKYADSINISNAAVNGNNAIQQANSDIKVNNLSVAETTDIQHEGNGDINLNNVKTGSLNVAQQGAGSIAINKAAVDGNSVIQQANGDIKIIDLSAGGSNTIQQANGNLTANNLTAGGIADIQHEGSGNIALDNVQAETLHMAQQGAGSIAIGKAAVNGNSAIEQANGDTQISDLTAGGSSTIEQSGGNLQITNLTAGGSNTIQQSGGTLKVNNLTAGGIADIQHEGNGNINLDNVQAETLHVAQQGAGSIAIGRAAINGNSTIWQANGDIQVDTLTAGGNSTIQQANGNLTANNLTAGETMDIQHTGNGSIALGNVNAADLNVAHSGIGNIEIGTAVIRNTSKLHQEGTGDIILKDFQGGHDISFVTRNGSMDFAKVSGTGRITLFNYGRDTKTTIGELSGANLFLLLAFNEDFGSIQSNACVDLLRTGDKARRAIGWEGAEELYRGMQGYLFRQNLPDFGERIGIESFTAELPADASQDEIKITE